MKSRTSRKAVGYIRVSKQNEKGVALDFQAEKIRAMACVHDAEVEIVADDGAASTRIGQAYSGCSRWSAGVRLRW
jgi:hypothetical protein